MREKQAVYIYDSFVGGQILLFVYKNAVSTVSFRVLRPLTPTVGLACGPHWGTEPPDPRLGSCLTRLPYVLPPPQLLPDPSLNLPPYIYKNFELQRLGRLAIHTIVMQSPSSEHKLQKR